MRALRPLRLLPEVVLVAAFAMLLPLLRPGIVTAAPGLPILSTHSATIVEGPGPDPTMRFVVTLDRPAASDVTVIADTFSGSATADVDFVSLTATTVTIPAGATSTLLDVTVLDDAMDEGESEWFLLQLSDPVGAAFAGGGVVQYRGTIYDDELTFPPAPVLRTGQPTVVEGDAGDDTTLRFVVALDRATDVPVSFMVDTFAWTAAADADFVPLLPTTIIIDPGDTIATIDVTVHGDAEDEGLSEGLYLSLHDPSGADFGFGSTSTIVFGTILDDDDTVPPLPRISVARTVAIEGSGSGGTLRFPVILDRASDVPVTVHVATRDWTASAPDDYDAIADDLVTFAPGDTIEEVDIQLVGDTVDEGDGEFLQLELSDPSGADFGGYTSAVDYRGDLLDDDGAGAALVPPSVGLSSASVVEGPAGTDTALHFSVTLTARPPRPFRSRWRRATGARRTPTTTKPCPSPPWSSRPARSPRMWSCRSTAMGSTRARRKTCRSSCRHRPASRSMGQRASPTVRSTMTSRLRPRRCSSTSTTRRSSRVTVQPIGS